MFSFKSVAFKISFHQISNYYNTKLIAQKQSINTCFATPTTPPPITPATAGDLTLVAAWYSTSVCRVRATLPNRVRFFFHQNFPSFSREKDQISPLPPPNHAHRHQQEELQISTLKSNQTPQFFNSVDHNCWAPLLGYQSKHCNNSFSTIAGPNPI